MGVPEGTFDRVESGRTTVAAAPKPSGFSLLKVLGIVFVTNALVLIISVSVTHEVVKDKYEEDPVVAATPSTPCLEAEPQAPRDVSNGAIGYRVPKLNVISWDQIYNNLTHVNTHFHLGAEHRSAGEYDIVQTKKAAGGPTPGLFCSTSALQPQQLSPYTFQYCHDVKVGETYELHWVHSSNGVSVGGGLGGAFQRGLNPGVAVQAQVFTVVNDANNLNDNLMRAFDTTLGTANNIKYYMGSTTGGSYDDVTCSPFTVSWYVDTKCHLISASSFDKMCKDLKDLGAEADIHPHSSRKPVHADYVVPESYVLSLA